MKRSTDRILTTHAGSLPRPEDLTRMMWDEIDGKDQNKDEVQARIVEAVEEAVKKQKKAGIDIISDGEMSKIGFSNYVIQRYSGFGRAASFTATDLSDFPDIATKIFANEAGAHLTLPCVEGPLELKDPDAVQRDIANLKAAMGGADPDGAFIPAVSPGQMLFNFPNLYYRTDAEYLEAAAKALAVEYKAIIDAGFNLQLDAPDLPMHSHSSSQAEGKGIPVDHHITAAIEAMNLAIEGLPREKIRLHLCWGNYAGPHHHDIELIDLVDDVIKAKVGFLYVEAANPRHEHEWEIWKEKKLPDDMALIAGMIDTLTNHVEHPRLIAQRLGRFASVLGRERVIAGTDCGFSTFVGWSGCDPAVSWLKLEALAQGAAIASDELFRA
jgi:5-methyltetrahydropteroyltriglutamate--homocysteine methyltransferase